MKQLPGIIIVSLLVFVIEAKPNKYEYPKTEMEAEELILNLRGLNLDNSKDKAEAEKIFGIFKAEHGRLRQEGYVFIGWRGIKPCKDWKNGQNDKLGKETKECTAQMDAENYLKHNRVFGQVTFDSKIKDKFYKDKGDGWQGMYLATFVDVVYGYVGIENDRRMSIPKKYFPWIFRVYLKKTDIEQIPDIKKWIFDKDDFKPILNPNPSNMTPKKRNEYIYYGKEDGQKEDAEGYELVLSPSVAQKAKFILSTYSAKGYTAHQIETSRTGFDLNKKKNVLKKNTGEILETKIGTELPNIQINERQTKNNLKNGENKF